MDTTPEQSLPSVENPGGMSGADNAQRLGGDSHVPGSRWPQNFGLLVESLPDPYILLRPIRHEDGRIVDFTYLEANRAARDFNRLSLDEMARTTLLSLFPSLVDSNVLSSLARTIDTGQPSVLENVLIEFSIGEKSAPAIRRFYDIHGVKADDSVVLNWYEVTAQNELLERYRVLAENASDIVVQLDPQGVVRWISSSVDGLGWSVEELVGREFESILDETSCDQWRERLSEITNHQGVTLDLALRGANESVHHYSVTTRLVGGGNGGADAVVGSMRCTDAEFEAHQALAVIQERYRLVVENSSDVVVLGNEAREIEWVSESVRSLLGWQPSEMMGRTYRDFVHPDDDVIVNAAYQAMTNGLLEEYEVRLRTSDGSYRWISISVHEIVEPGGRLVRVAAWRNAESEVAARLALESSEAQFRILAENASDVVYQTDVDGIIHWVSPSVTRVLGWRPEEVVGRFYGSLICEDDRELTAGNRLKLLQGSLIEPFEVRYFTSEGNLRWMSIDPRPVYDAQGEVASLVVGLRDHQNVVAHRKAAQTLSAGSRLLFRAEDEQALLSEMCQIAVEECGYEFAWYGRPVKDAQKSVAKVAMSLERHEYLDDLQVTWADDPYGQGPVGRAIRTGVAQVTGDFASDFSYSPWMNQTQAFGLRSSIGLPVQVDGVIDGVLSVYAAESNAFEDAAISVLEDLASEIGYGLKRLRDNDRLIKSMNEQSMLSSIISEAGEAVVVTDAEFVIIYVNPAALRTSGFDLDELLGQTPSIFRLDLDTTQANNEPWTRLHPGETWRGVLQSRRKSGEVFDEETTISPIHDNNNLLSAYVLVKRDLTKERRLEADLTREMRTRVDIVEVMKRVQPGASVNETVERFCRSLLSLESVDAAAVFVLQDRGELVRIGIHSSPHLHDTEAGYDLFNVPLWMLERTAVGPWWQLSREWRGEISVLFETALGRDIVANAVVPVLHQGEMLAVLAIGTRDPTASRWMGSQLNSFEEMGTYAGTLFGGQARAHQQRVKSRSHIRSIIDEQLFRPVFQPFVNLATKKIVGYEALTRFDDQLRPDLRFIEAHGVGLGTELEAACARAGLEVAKQLDPSHWLSINFSPAALLDGRAAAVLNGARRPLVIEVTEHAPIKNYAAVRKAVRDLGDCRLAVDDAGAGFTSLNHILELRPDLVKLDISLVRDIDSDPARQAMTAGMCHFAAETGTVVVAEGIETEAEAEMLLKIGVPVFASDLLGQGYYFGHPVPLT